MEKKLQEMKLAAHRGGDPPLTGEELETYLSQLPDWDVVEEDGVRKVQRTFDFKNFAEALAFTNRVGEAAEEEGHHPVITVTWGKATVTWYTHSIKGLHQNDFIMAAKTDDRYSHR